MVSSRNSSSSSVDTARRGFMSLLGKKPPSGPPSASSGLSGLVSGGSNHGSSRGRGSKNNSTQSVGTASARNQSTDSVSSEFDDVGSSKRSDASGVGLKLDLGKAEASWETIEPPEEFICPLSLEVMFDPVIVSSGQTYERAFITRWIKEGHTSCPKTRQPLDPSAIFPNQVLKVMIMDWCKDNGVPQPTPRSAETADSTFAQARSGEFGLPQPLWRNRVAAEIAARAQQVALESERRQRMMLQQAARQQGLISAAPGGPSRRRSGLPMRQGTTGRTWVQPSGDSDAMTTAPPSSNLGDAVGSGPPPPAGEDSAEEGTSADAAAGASDQLSGSRPRRRVAAASSDSVSEDRWANGVPKNASLAGGTGGLALAGWPGKLAMKAAIFKTQEWPMVKEEDGQGAAPSGSGSAAPAAGEGASSSSSSSAAVAASRPSGSGSGAAVVRPMSGSIAGPSAAAGSFLGSSGRADGIGSRTPSGLGSRSPSHSRGSSGDISRGGGGGGSKRSLEKEIARALARDLRSVSIRRDDEEGPREAVAGGASPGDSGPISSAVSLDGTESAFTGSVSGTSIAELKALDVEQLVDNVRGGAPEDQAAGAALLRVMTRHGFRYTKKVVDAGAIEPLIELMWSPDEPTAEHAVTALLNLSLEDAIKVEIAFKDRVVEGMVYLLNNGMPQARANAAAALFSLSTVGGIRDRIFDDTSAIPGLVMLLDEGGLRGKKDAANCLVSLCMSKEHRSVIASSGVISILCRLLQEGVDSVEEQTAAIFAGCVRDPEGRNVLFDEGAIPALAELVEGGTTNRCREYAVNALLGLAVNSNACLAAIDEEGISASIDVLTRTGTTKTQAKATALLELLRKFDTQGLEEDEEDEEDEETE